jgi:hypothetical protein
MNTSVAGSGMEAAADFSHENRPFGSFYQENEKTFLSAVECAKRCCEPERRGDGLEEVNSNELAGCFKALPCEIMLLVLEQLDLATLVATASVNTYMRGLVQGMADVRKIQQSVYSARALSRMYTTGTARYFSLPNFMKALTSPGCGICDRQSEFAVYFCMMRCCRICRLCRVSSASYIPYLPVELAKRIFDVDDRDISGVEPSARILVPPSAQHGDCPVHSTSCGDGEWRSVDIVHAEHAFEMAMYKHRNNGASMHIKMLVNDYLVERRVEFRSARRQEDDIIFPGFTKGVQEYWRFLGICGEFPKHMLMTTLPYLHPRTHPAKFDPGLWCEGCMRDVVVNRHSTGDKARYPGGLPTHLENAFPDHARHCKTAQDISKGVFLKISVEWKLLGAVRREKSSYWPERAQVPLDLRAAPVTHPAAERNKTAQQFREWYVRTMQRIVDLGEKDVLCRRRLAIVTQQLNAKVGHFPTPGSGVEKGTADDNSVGTVTKTTKFGSRSEFPRGRCRTSYSKKVKPMDLRRHLSNMPSWLRSTKSTRVMQLQSQVRTKSERLDWLYCEPVGFKAGPIPVTVRVRDIGEKITKATKRTAEDEPAGEYLPSRPVATKRITLRYNTLQWLERLEAVAKLERIGIARDRCLIPGLWQMRTRSEDTAESDEEDVDAADDEVEEIGPREEPDVGLLRAFNAMRI